MCCPDPYAHDSTEGSWKRAASGGYLCDAAGAPPVPFWDLVEWGDEAEGVVAVVTAIAQQHAGLLVPATTNAAHDLVDLQTHTHVTRKEEKVPFKGMYTTNT